jgi:hypothetical protein
MWRRLDFWRADKCRAASDLIIIGRILLGKACVIARQSASSRHKIAKTVPAIETRRLDGRIALCRAMTQAFTPKWRPQAAV